MLALHSPNAVFSRRHVPSWLLLAGSAGVVNALAFLSCKRFVTHVTGTISLMGMDTKSAFLALDYAAILAAFVVGAMTSAVMIDGRYHRDRPTLHAAPMFAVTGILAAVGIIGVAGAFGPFGGSVEGARDFVFLGILAFAMGLQNAAVATSTGMLVRTTHMTGPATDLGVHLATAYFTVGETRRLALRHAALRAGKIAAFTVGALVGAVVAPSLHYGAFLIPAAIVLAATLLSFVRAPSASASASSAQTPQVSGS